MKDVYSAVIVAGDKYLEALSVLKIAQYSTVLEEI